MSVWRRRSRPQSAALIASLAVAFASCGGPPVPSPPSPGPSAQQPSSPSLPSATLSSAPAESPAPTPATAGARPGFRLLLLAGRPGAMTLDFVDGAGPRTGITLPDPDSAWISTDRSGRALVTARTGRAWRSDPIHAANDPSWWVVQPAGLAPARLPGPLAFGTLAPDGKRAAFVSARFGSGGTSTIVVVDVTSQETRPLNVARQAEGAPPAWAGPDLLVVTRERGDLPGVTRLDPASGTVNDGPGPPGGAWSSVAPGGWTGRVDGLSVSADGSTVAVASGANSSFEIHATEPWLAGHPDAPTRVTLAPTRDGSTGYAWLALSGDGQELAVVRTDDAGDATGVEIYAADAGWERTRTIDLPPGADRAVVAWLPDQP